MPQCSVQQPPSLIQSRKAGCMTGNTISRFFGVAIVLCVTSACSDLPTAASRNEAFTPIQPSGAAASVRLSNLRGTYLGRANKLCDAQDSSVAIDRLSFDYEVSGGNLAGALLVKCDSGNCMSGVPLGNVTACPRPPSPCDPETRDALEQGLAPACLTGDPTATGSVDVLAVTPWQENSNYVVMAFFEESGKRSNTVSTVVGHQAP